MSGSHFFFSSLFWEILSTYATEVNSWSRFHWRSLYQGCTDVLQIFRHWKLKSMWIGHACCEVSTINLSLSHDGSMALWQYWNRVHSLARVLHWTRCSQIQVALPKNDQLLLTSQPNICHNPAVIQLCMTRHACFSTRVKDFNNSAVIFERDTVQDTCNISCELPVCQLWLTNWRIVTEKMNLYATNLLLCFEYKY